MKITTSLAALLAAVATVSTAGAQDSYNMKFSSVFPATHWTWERGGAVFAEKVGELTDGRVTFDLYPAGQLGKESVSMLGSGLAETAILVPSYEPSRLPLTSVAELPGFYDSSCEGTAKLWHSLQEGGPLYEAEYKAQGLVPIYVNVLPSFQLMTSAKQVIDVADVEGLKLRANGTAMVKTATLLGAVPVSVTTTEFYDSMKRGTVDGGVYYMGSVKQTGVDGVLRYALDGAQLGGGATVYAISQKAWDRMDADTQAAMLQAGQATQQELCQTLDVLQDEVRDELIDAGILTYTRVEGEARDQWLTVLEPVSQAWAEQMDETGRAGSAVLDAYRATDAAF